MIIDESALSHTDKRDDAVSFCNRESRGQKKDDIHLQERGRKS